MKDCFRETLARIRVYEVLFSKMCNPGATESDETG